MSTLQTRTDHINQSLQLLQDESGFAFGTDALLLSAYLPSMPKGRALELGAGNGVVSLLAASYHKFDTIYAVEIQEGSASLARQNAKNRFIWKPRAERSQKSVSLWVLWHPPRCGPTTQKPC